MVQQVEIGSRIQAVTLRQQLLANHQCLYILMPRFGQLNLALLFVDGEVARLFLRVRLEQGDHAIDALVQLGAVFGCARDYQRRARLVDQDRVYLVHDGKAQRPLQLILQRERHIVPQVIKAELVVGAVDNVATIGRALFLLGQP